MAQVDFWSNNPCGIKGALSDLIHQRYRMEPWLPRELRTIPTDRKKYLEVGCGQGIDCFYICSNLIKGTQFTAIHFSSESVKRAEEHLKEAKKIFDLRVTPDFSVGDALNLDFDDEEFDYVYSQGVIHHTPDPQKAINEIYRVLKKGGRAKVFLYKRYSLKSLGR